MKNQYWGKNGPWYKNIAVGLLLYSACVIPLAGSLLMHKNIGKPLQIGLFVLAVAGTVIILTSIIYNFARQRHCVDLSRSNDTLLDAGVIALPEYLRRQTLLAAEIERLDSLTKP